LHGSYANGTYNEHSDIDIMTDDFQLIRLNLNFQNKFCLLNDISNAKIPRILLLHVNSQFEVDLIENTHDKYHQLKDLIIAKYIAFDEKILQYIKLVKYWVKANIR